ncbi:unnamed protein product, partial [Prorocentrum cordatum]
MERFNAKLDGLNERIEELAAPSPGKGWAAALAFSQQAEKCLDSGTEQHEQLAAALDHAKEQKKKEEAAAKHAERLKKAEAERAASTARERADRDRSASVDTDKRRCPDGGYAEEDLIELEAGASELDISKALIGAGVTPEQADKVVGALKFLVGELQPGCAITASLAAHAVDANTVGSLERAMMQITRLDDKDAIVLGQELQTSVARLELSQTRMRKQGWDTGTASSAETDSGHSAGVLIATARSRGMDFVRKGINQWDISPRESKRRLALAWVDAYSRT